jgi:hypothetical protein
MSSKPPACCRSCGAPLADPSPAGGRPRAYCSNACRQKGYRRRRDLPALAVPKSDDVLRARREERESWRNQTMIDFYSRSLLPGRTAPVDIRPLSDEEALALRLPE